MANNGHVSDFSNLNDEPVFELKILSEKVKRMEKFKRTTYSTIFTVKHINTGSVNILSITIELEDIFDSIIKKSLNQAQPEDRVGVSIFNNTLYLPIFVPYHRVKDYNISKVFERIEMATQRNISFLLDEPLTIEVNIVEKF